MIRVRKILVFVLCFVLIFTGSVFAAETEGGAEQAPLEEQVFEETGAAGDEVLLEDPGTDLEPALAEDPENTGADEVGFEEEDPMPGDFAEDEELIPADIEEGPASEDTEETAAEADSGEEDEELTGEPEEEIPSEETEEEDGIEKADAKVRASISILSSDANVGTFTFSVSGLDAVENLNKVKLQIWHSSDKSDLYTYSAKKQADGTYQATMYKYRHQDHTGSFTVEAYVYYTDGTSERAAKTTVTVNDPAPVITISRNVNTYTFTTSYIPGASKVSKVRYAIWSNNNGQDDLQWYDVSIKKQTASAVFTSDLPEHSETGMFHVHVYAVNSQTGEQDFVQESTFHRVFDGQPSAYYYYSEVDKKAGKFSIRTRNIYSPTGISKLKIEVWCKGRKKDLVTYTANAYENGLYSFTSNIKKHSYNRGTYHYRAYVIDSAGKKLLLYEDTFNMKTNCTAVAVTTTDQVKYTAKVKKLLFPGGVKKVQFAVWSQTGGQDDIVWYNAKGTNGGSFSGTFNMNKHKHYGTFNVHVYATAKNGNRILVKTATFTAMPKVEYKFSKKGLTDGNGKFSVGITVKKTGTPINKIKYEVWCSPDKSDVYWYPITLSSNGQAKATINTMNHYGHTGTYYVNIVAQFKDGLEGSIGTRELEFTPVSYLSIPVSNGKSTRKVTYVNPNVPSVQFKVWTVRGGSTDSKTYTGKSKKAGEFYANIKMSDFIYDGKYNVEVYSGSSKLDSGSFIMLDYLEEGYKMALDDTIGYSQIRRCLNPDVDCSSFVHYALKNTGYNVGSGWPLTTYNEESVLRGVGFSMFAYTNISDLQPGDILLRDGHTEIYAGHGTTVGAHGDENDDIYGHQTGDQTGSEVCIAPLVERWQYVFRLVTYTP